MRLLDSRTAEFEWTDKPHSTPYAILSHVWARAGDGALQEQTYDDLVKIQRSQSSWKAKIRRKTSLVAFPAKVSEKIRRCCAIALEQGYERVWIDSCCIDKSSSSELSEAVNSMFKWYQHAEVCYAYLQDVDDGDDPRAEGSQFRRSRWFSRGWTLQELIAPRVVIFFSRGWCVLGSKANLAGVVEEVTGIDASILTHETPLDEASVATRISWASRRQTTREEDEAYSLMGILRVNLPIIYGEGRLAFIRLQEEVLRQTSDESLFTWGRALRDNHELTDNTLSGEAYMWENPDVLSESPYMQNLFARSPRDFVFSGRVMKTPRHLFMERLPFICPLPEYAVTSHGVRTTVPLLACKFDQSEEELYFALLASQDHTGRVVALLLRKQEGKHSEYLVGGFLSPTMMIEDGANSTGDGRLSLGASYFRTTLLTPQFIAAYREEIRLQEVYVQHAPSRGADLDTRKDRLLYTALTQCQGLFDVQLAGWCLPLLQGEGFTVTPLTQADAMDTGVAKQGFLVSRPSHAFRIEMDICRCMEGMTHRWLRVAVAAEQCHKQHTETSPSSLAINARHAFSTMHPRDHSDHVLSWKFSEGHASQRFQSHFIGGEALHVQLTLNFASRPSVEIINGLHLPKTYILGIQMVPPQPSRKS